MTTTCVLRKSWVEVIYITGKIPSRFWLVLQLTPSTRLVPIDRSILYCILPIPLRPNLRWSQSKFDALFHFSYPKWYRNQTIALNSTELLTIFSLSHLHSLLQRSSPAAQPSQNPAWVCICSVTHCQPAISSSPPSLLLMTAAATS